MSTVTLQSEIDFIFSSIDFWIVHPPASRVIWKRTKTDTADDFVIAKKKVSVAARCFRYPLITTIDVCIISFHNFVLQQRYDWKLKMYAPIEHVYVDVIIVTFNLKLYISAALRLLCVPLLLNVNQPWQQKLFFCISNARIFADDEERRICRRQTATTHTHDTRRTYMVNYCDGWMLRSCAMCILRRRRIRTMSKTGRPAGIKLTLSRL